MSEFLENLRNSHKDDWIRIEILDYITSLENQLNPQTGTMLKNGPIQMDYSSKRCWHHGVEVSLTPKEFKLLEYHMQNLDKALTVREIMRHVWGPAYNEDQAQYLRVCLPKIRKKFGEGVIETHRGYGYIMRRQE